LPRFSRQAEVAYTPQQMYDLVRDVACYPQFLPWCSEAEVLQEDSRLQVARLTMKLLRVQFNLTTSNLLQPGRRIDMELLRGRLRRLRGHWRFEPLPGGGCRIAMEVEFEFNSVLLQRTLGRAFETVVQSMVDAFVQRAEQLHGRR